MSTMNIKVTKAGKSLEVNLQDLPDEAYQFVLQKGLEALLNARMSKVLTKDLEGEKLAEAQAAAQPKRPLTTKEKLDKMREVNPLVADLLNRFDLKLDE